MFESNCDGLRHLTCADSSKSERQPNSHRRYHNHSALHLTHYLDRMTSGDLHAELLRPAVLQILRAAGFGYARPAVVDTVTDLAGRYLNLLASSTAQNAFTTHNTNVPTIQDVRLALTLAGALVPQMGAAEESLKGDVEIDGVMVPFEDLRGVQNFVNWAQGPVNKEIRRVAGFEDDSNLEEIAGLDEHEDYLTGEFDTQPR